MCLIPLKYLKGKFFRCVNYDSDFKDNILDIKSCFDYGGDWVDYDFAFNNVFQSFYNLFVIATSEGWSPYMVDTWDAF